MRRVRRTPLGAVFVGLSTLAFAPLAQPAEVETHRVAAVDPDEELARALELALLPWNAVVVTVHPEGPGATMPMAVDRARNVAREAIADVVVWVSTSDAGYALWIYDVASDHASARPLAEAPPFDAATAAGVALAVKALLRGTLVAPPPERFGAVRPEPNIALGVSAGGRVHVGSSFPPEGRVAAEVSLWPASLGHRWGLSAGVATGTGLQADSAAFSGTLQDTAFRLGADLRFPLSHAILFGASLGGAVHRVSLDGVLSEGPHVVVERADFAVEPRLGVDVSLFRGRLLVGPWFGLSVLTRWQRFLVHGVSVVDAGPVAAESAVRLEALWP